MVVLNQQPAPRRTRRDDPSAFPVVTTPRGRPAGPRAPRDRGSPLGRRVHGPAAGPSAQAMADDSDGAAQAATTEAPSSHATWRRPSVGPRSRERRTTNGRSRTRPLLAPCPQSTPPIATRVIPSGQDAPQVGAAGIATVTSERWHLLSARGSRPSATGLALGRLPCLTVRGPLFVRHRLSAGGSAGRSRRAMSPVVPTRHVLRGTVAGAGPAG
jgi:hypothetical protein